MIDDGLTVVRKRRLAHMESAAVLSGEGCRGALQGCEGLAQGGPAVVTPGISETSLLAYVPKERIDYMLSRATMARGGTAVAAMFGMAQFGAVLFLHRRHVRSVRWKGHLLSLRDASW